LRVNQAKFAEILGKSPEYVRLLSEQGMPAERNGKRGAQVFIHTEKAIAWLVQRERLKVEAELAPNGATVEAETRRLRGAQADLCELEAAEKRGDLVPVEDVQIAISESNVILRGQMEAVASRCCGSLAAMRDAAQIRHYLLGEIRRALSAAAARLEEWTAAVAKGEADRLTRAEREAH
jgi:phage terminase Nu1 subunit (DNA packaging protein)